MGDGGVDSCDLIPASMLHNYLKIAVRSLRRQPLYTAINVVGLGVSLALCVLIFLYAHDELTFDRFHADAERIYRVLRVQHAETDRRSAIDVAMPTPLGPALTSDFGQVEDAVRLFELDYYVRHDDDASEHPILFADPSLFQVFSFPLLRGRADEVLDDLNSIVLSEAAARRHFGPDDPVGKTLDVRLEDRYESFLVTGVARDVPPNSTIQFDYVVPFDQLAASVDWMKRRLGNWQTSAFQTYVLLNAPASLSAVEAGLPAFRRQHYPTEEENARSQGRWTGEGPPTSYALQPLGEIHLTPDIPGGQVPSSSPLYSYILMAIGVGMLAIACINFTTLAIGRSSARAQEVGIRRVSGARRGQLFGQFWSESLLLATLAVGLGILLAYTVLPIFNELADKQTSLDAVATPVGIGVLVLLTLATGLAAGVYPALILSSFRPVDVLKQQAPLGGTNWFTRGLLVAQFGLSIFLIISTLLMREQLDFVRSANLGFDRDQVVVVPTQGLDGRALLDRAENHVAGQRALLDVTGISNSFNQGWSRMGFDYKGEVRKNIFYYTVAPNFLDVMDIELAAGRDVDERRTADVETSVIVNEALVRDFGWTDPVGEVLDGFAPDDPPEPDPQVIGVVEDFHFLSLREEVEPMLLSFSDMENYRFLLFKLAPGATSEGLEAVRAAWTDLTEGVPFEYTFLDDDLARQYEGERRWSSIVTYASAFAILIACMGLFGLAALAVTRRRKEIGIRKVLGASVANVTALLSQRFILLVLLGFVVAAPAAYFAMSSWLDTFAYRIELSNEIGAFVLAGLLAAGIALLSVAYQTVKAAVANPADSLRYE